MVHPPRGLPEAVPEEGLETPPPAARTPIGLSPRYTQATEAVAPEAAPAMVSGGEDDTTSPRGNAPESNTAWEQGSFQQSSVEAMEDPAEPPEFPDMPPEFASASAVSAGRSDRDETPPRHAAPGVSQIPGDEPD